MIAVWIIAFSFTIVGAAFCFPKYYRIFTCKNVTSGKMLSWQSPRSNGNSTHRASYEYFVNGVRYTGNTGWTSNGIFSASREYLVRYNPKKPEKSYISMTGMYLNCAAATLIFLAGLFAFGVGFLLTAAL